MGRGLDAVVVSVVVVTVAAAVTAVSAAAVRLFLPRGSTPADLRKPMLEEQKRHLACWSLLASLCPGDDA